VGFLQIEDPLFNPTNGEIDYRSAVW